MLNKVDEGKKRYQQISRNVIDAPHPCLPTSSCQVNEHLFQEEEEEGREWRREIKSILSVSSCRASILFAIPVTPAFSFADEKMKSLTQWGYLPMFHWIKNKAQFTATDWMEIFADCMAKTSSKYDFSRLQTQGETKADKARRTGHGGSLKWNEWKICVSIHARGSLAKCSPNFCLRTFYIF